MDVVRRADISREHDRIGDLHLRMPFGPVREFLVAGTARKIRRDQLFKSIQLIQILRCDDRGNALYIVLYSPAGELHLRSAAAQGKGRDTQDRI